MFSPRRNGSCGSCVPSRVSRCVPRARRLQPVAYTTTGPTPMRGIGLPLGSYLLDLVAPGRHPVSFFRFRS